MLLVTSLTPNSRDLDFHEKEGQELEAVILAGDRHSACVISQEAWEQGHPQGSSGPPKRLSMGLSPCLRLYTASHCSIRGPPWEEIADLVSAHPGLRDEGQESLGSALVFPYSKPVPLLCLVGSCIVSTGWFPGQL